MRFRSTFPTLAAAAILAAPFVGADDFRWQGKVAPGSAIEVKGVNGAIEASAASGDQVEVVAAKKARKSDPSEVTIEVVEHEGGVTICAVYPSQGDRPNECRPGSEGRMSTKDNDVQVRFDVRVPAGVRFVGRTVNGSIDARALPADGEAYTVNGAIEIEAGGLARAETVNGGIRARLGRADWKDRLEFKTVNGGIVVELPASAGAEVEARTVNGDIETDFPLTVQGRFSKRRLSGTIGGGGRQLDLETVNGGIELRRTR